MVDNEQLEARGTDEVEKETTIPVACCSADPALAQGQTGRLVAVADDGQGDGVIDRSIDDEKSTSVPSAETSDILRQIVIDGSNIAMRFEVFS